MFNKQIVVSCICVLSMLAFSGCTDDKKESSSAKESKATKPAAKALLPVEFIRIAKEKLQIKRQVADAYFLLMQAKDIMELSEGLIKSSKLKYHQTQRRYESDLADYIELQDAQKDYINAGTSLANSYYDYYIALALVDLAIGKDYAF